MKRNLQRRHKSLVKAGTKRKPSLWVMGEGHGRYLGAWSGYLGILRRKGCGTVGRLSWELERASLAPFLREREAHSPITGVPGKWWIVERQSEGVIVVLESSGQHNPA